MVVSVKKRRLVFRLMIFVAMAVSSVNYIFSYLEVFDGSNLTFPIEETDTQMEQEEFTQQSSQYQYENYKAQCEKELLSPNCSAGIVRRLTRNISTEWSWQGSFTDDDYFDLKKILLVIQFNDAHYVAASKAYELYYRLFADIIFCGPGRREYDFWPKNASFTVKNVSLSLPEHVRFVGYDYPTRNQGENSYSCVDLAAEITFDKGEDYEGLLMAGDDVMLNVWAWKHWGKSIHKNWVTRPDNSVTMFNIDSLDFCRGKSSNSSEDCSPKLRDWGWQKRYKDEHRAFFAELEHLAQLNSSAFWSDYLANLTMLTGGPRRLHTGYSDIIYISKQYLPTIRPIFRLMNKHRVFSEAATHSAIRAAITSSEVQFIDTSGHDWGNGFIRYRPMMEAFWTGWEYVHPFKLGLVFREEAAQFLLDETKLIKGGSTRGRFKLDPTISCVYCYIRNWLRQYAHRFL